MKDPRCLVGLHDYQPPLSPATDRSAYDVPGLKLDRTRCKKSRMIHVGPPSTHHGPGLGAYGGGTGG